LEAIHRAAAKTTDIPTATPQEADTLVKHHQQPINQAGVLPTTIHQHLLLPIHQPQHTVKILLRDTFSSPAIAVLNQTTAVVANRTTSRTISMSTMHQPSSTEVRKPLPRIMPVHMGRNTINTVAKPQRLLVTALTLHNMEPPRLFLMEVDPQAITTAAIINHHHQADMAVLSHQVVMDMVVRVLLLHIQELSRLTLVTCNSLNTITSKECITRRTLVACMVMDIHPSMGSSDGRYTGD